MSQRPQTREGGEQVVDINIRPFVLAELAGTITTLPSGAAQLGPAQGAARSWASTLARLRGKGTFRHVAVILECPKDQRTLQANAYLWVCYGVLLDGLRAIAADTRTECPFADTDEVHAWWKRHELGDIERVEFAGAEIERRTSTTRLPGPKFYRYVENLREMAFHRWQISIPEPRDVGEDAWLDGRPWKSLGDAA